MVTYVTCYVGYPNLPVLYKGSSVISNNRKICLLQKIGGRQTSMEYHYVHNFPIRTVDKK